MKTDKNLKFKLNVSIDTYSNKTEAQDCVASRTLAKRYGKEKMSFVEKEVTTDEFLGLARKGHSFANLFDLDKSKMYFYSWRGFRTYTYAYYQKGKNKGGLKLNFKTNEHYLGQQVIFVDIDYTNFDSIYDYIDCLAYTPTVVYTSFSDLKMKGGVVSRRFRLVYVFDRVLVGNEVESISEVLYKSIVEDTCEEIEDCCGLVGAQYMNGTNGGEVYNSNIIYSIKDFVNEVTEIEDSTEVELEEVEEIISKKERKDVKINEYLVADMSRLSYEEFMKWNHNKYPFFYRTEKEEWINDCYQMTDENYLSLFYNINKVEDGSKRRKKLFERMCLRRVINPDATPETILFNAYVDLNRYFETTDITVDILKRNVINTFKLTVDEIKELYKTPIANSSKKRPTFIIKKKAGETIKETISKTRKILKDSLIGNLYDDSLTIEENLKIMNSNGVKVAKSRLYQFVKDNGLEKKKSHKYENILEHIDVNKSIRENLNYIESLGIKTNLRQVREAIKNVK